MQKSKATKRTESSPKKHGTLFSVKSLFYIATLSFCIKFQSLGVNFSPECLSS